MNVPLIKLFRTPNSLYFLDVNSDELLSVSDTSFLFLNDLLARGENSGACIPSEILAYREQGYLAAESTVREIKHVYTGFLPVVLGRKLTKITLQLTQNCNLRCKYCIYSEEANTRQRSHSVRSMGWDTAKKALDFLWVHSIDSPSINIGFYGGEPLLEFPLIRKIMEYCHILFKGKEVTYNITTNATLLTDEIIHYLYDQKISMMVSLDGPKEINDMNRVFADGSGTFDTVTENVRRIKETIPAYLQKLQISMVINPENDFDCVNEICLPGKDMESLNFSASIVDRTYDEAKTQFSEEDIWKFEYQRFLALLSSFGRFPRDEISPIAEKALVSALDDYTKIAKGGKLRSVDTPSGPCIPGQMRLFVNVDERLFPCERVSEHSSATCIGTLDEGINIEKARHILNVGRLTESACKECWCFRYCSICVKKADNNSDQLSAVTKLSFCEEARANALGMLQQYLLLKEVPLCYSTQIRKAVKHEKESDTI